MPLNNQLNVSWKERSSSDIPANLSLIFFSSSSKYLSWSVNSRSALICYTTLYTYILYNWKKCNFWRNSSNVQGIEDKIRQETKDNKKQVNWAPGARLFLDCLKLSLLPFVHLFWWCALSDNTKSLVHAKLTQTSSWNFRNGSFAFNSIYIPQSGTTVVVGYPFNGPHK